MADFSPKLITNITDINNGKEYINEVDVPNANDWNSVINSQLFTQGLAKNQPDVNEAGNVGTPSVELTTAPDGSAKLKFSNLKGETGQKGDKGDKGEDADTSNLVTLDTDQMITGSKTFEIEETLNEEKPFKVKKNGSEVFKVDKSGVHFDDENNDDTSLYFGGNAGTKGQVLYSNGAGTTPRWGDKPVSIKAKGNGSTEYTISFTSSYKFVKYYSLYGYIEIEKRYCVMAFLYLINGAVRVLAIKTDGSIEQFNVNQGTVAFHYTGYLIEETVN